MNEESRLNCMQSYWKTIHTVMKMSFLQISRNILGNLLNYNRCMHHPKTFVQLPWQVKQVLWSCLEWNPEDRPSAAKIFEARVECDSDTGCCWEWTAYLLKFEGNLWYMIYVNMSSGNHEKSDLEWYVWRVLRCFEFYILTILWSLTPVCVKTWTTIMFISPSRPYGSGSS